MTTQISCVCPTTAARWWCLPLAIECWQRQTHLERELVVVVDGDPYVPVDPLDPHGAQEHITNLIPFWDGQIRYVYLQGERTLGEKYNACIEVAQHDWVALWADDDWHAPTRLEATAALISDKIDIVADWTMIQHDLNTDATRRYVYPFTQPYLISGTMCFRRQLARAHPFPDQQRGSDDPFVHGLLQAGARVARLEQPPYFYVAMCHGRNITNQRLPVEDPAWQKLDIDLDVLMNGDLAKYEAAYLISR